MTKLTVEQLKEIKAAMLKVNFKYKQINGIHNFINGAIMEGIEVKADCSINPYWTDIDSKRYGYDAVGNETRNAVSILEQILMEDAKEAEIITKDEAQLYGILPENLTDALIDKHPGTIPCLVGLQVTPEQYLCERKGPGNKMITYVEGHVMKRQANYAFLFNWDSEILEMWDDEFEVSAEVRCTFRFSEGHTVVKTEVGGADKKFSKTLKDKDGNARQILIADTRKAAVTDAIKCCLRDLGMNNDVYSGVRKCQKKTK